MNFLEVTAEIRSLAKPMEGPRRVKLLALAHRLEHDDINAEDQNVKEAVEILTAASTWGEGTDQRFLDLAAKLDLVNYDDVEPTRDEEAPFADPVTAR